MTIRHPNHPHPSWQRDLVYHLAGLPVLFLEDEHHIEQGLRIAEPRQPHHQFIRNRRLAEQRNDQADHGLLRERQINRAIRWFSVPGHKYNDLEHHRRNQVHHRNGGDPCKERIGKHINQRKADPEKQRRHNATRQGEFVDVPAGIVVRYKPFGPVGEVFAVSVRHDAHQIFLGHLGKQDRPKRLFKDIAQAGAVASRNGCHKDRVPDPAPRQDAVLQTHLGSEQHVQIGVRWIGIWVQTPLPGDQLPGTVHKARGIVLWSRCKKRPVAPKPRFEHQRRCAACFRPAKHMPPGPFRGSVKPQTVKRQLMPVQAETVFLAAIESAKRSNR